MSLSVAVCMGGRISHKLGCLTSFVYLWVDLFVLSQKATKKTDKPRSEEVEVTDLTDEDLKEQLAKHGVETGPIVGESTCCGLCGGWFFFYHKNSVLSLSLFKKHNVYSE